MKPRVLRAPSRAPGLHPAPRRLPPPERLPYAGEWPANATGAERFDPLWQQLLKNEGFEAVRRRIDALRSATTTTTPTNTNTETQR